MNHLDQPSDARAYRSGPNGRRQGRRGRIAAAGAVAISALAIAGCGSSSSGRTAASQNAATPVASADGLVVSSGQSGGGAGQGSSSQSAAASKAVGSSHRVKKAARPHAGAAPKITRGNPVHRPAPGTGGNAANDENPAGKASAADSGTVGPANPCLVSRADSERFTGTAVAAPKIAPLGPTCVYVAKGGKTVTLAVEQTVFAKLKPHIRKLTSYTIGATHAYCGVYGSPITYVLLPRERVLVVAAPCDVGKRFATAALAKLS